MLIQRYFCTKHSDFINQLTEVLGQVSSRRRIGLCWISGCEIAVPIIVSSLCLYSLHYIKKPKKRLLYCKRFWIFLGRESFLWPNHSREELNLQCCKIVAKIERMFILNLLNHGGSRSKFGSNFSIVVFTWLIRLSYFISMTPWDWTSSSRLSWFGALFSGSSLSRWNSWSSCYNSLWYWRNLAELLDDSHP